MVSMSQRPLILGLTGGIACGKSLAGRYFQDEGIPVLDSDSVVQELYKDPDIQNKLIQEFGTYDKSKLATLIFGDEPVTCARRQKLEKILHPEVAKRFEAWLSDNSQAPLVVNLVPLLDEAKLESRYDKIVVISCKPELQLKRMGFRNPELSSLELEKRIKSQLSQEIKAQKADFVIDNSGSPEELRVKIKDFLINLFLCKNTLLL